MGGEGKGGEKSIVGKVSGGDKLCAIASNSKIRKFKFPRRRAKFFKGDNSPPSLTETLQSAGTMITLHYMKSGAGLPHTLMLADINQHTSHAIPTTVTGMFTEWMIDYRSQSVSGGLEIRSS